MESETLRQQFQALQEQQQKKLLKRKQRQEEKNKKKDDNGKEEVQQPGDMLGISDDLGLTVSKSTWHNQQRWGVGGGGHLPGTFKQNTSTWHNQQRWGFLGEEVNFVCLIN